MRFKGILALAALVLAVTVPTASAQIISTSIPKEFAPGAVEKNWAFHVMGGYVYWDYAALQSDQDVEFTTAQGFIIAGDVAFNVNETIALGVGGFYNNAPFDANFPSLGISPAAEIDNSSYSLYGNVFYKMVGAQVGLVGNSSTMKWSDTITNALPGIQDESWDSTDLDFYAVGRFGEDRWSLGLGLGGYQYRGEGASETVFSGFVNGSVKVYQNLSLDGGLWYIGSSSAGDDSASRLTVGVGYTF